MSGFIVAVVLCLCAAASVSQKAGAAPETWSEIKTSHFTVWSSAGDGAARTMTWQLEQIRAATAALWPWAIDADPKAAGAHVAEGLQLEREGKREEAFASYGKAVELGATNAWPYYRAAILKWGDSTTPDPGTLRQMETQLARAVELQPTFAAAYASLAEIRAALGQAPGAVMPLLSKAISLEPASPWHRLAGARVLWRFGSAAEARQTAQAALAMADTDAARREAERLLAAIPKAP